MRRAPPTYRLQSSSSFRGSPQLIRARGARCEMLRRLARASPVRARDDEKRAFQAARLEDSLHLLADGRAHVFDAAAVECPHDGGPRQLERGAALGLDRLTEP